MQTYSINQIHIIQETETIFKIYQPFEEGVIEVYVNGVLQTFEENYVISKELDGYNIVFNEEINAGSLLYINTDVDLDETVFRVLSYGRRDNPNALYQRFSSDNKLKFNNKYTVHLKVDDEDVDWSFASSLTPLFSTVKKIIEGVGEFIQGFTEEYILSTIHKNSWEITNRISDALENNEEIRVDNIQKDPTTGEYINIYRHVSDWVKIKTQIDLIWARYYGISYNYGSVSKSIGDIEISKTTKLPYVDELLKRLNAQLADKEELIFGGLNVTGTYVKGSRNHIYAERGTF